MAVLVEAGKADLGTAVADKCGAEERLRLAEAEVERVAERGRKLKEALETRVRELERELEAEREERPESHSPPNRQMPADSEAGALRGELHAAAERITQLESVCKQLEREKDTLAAGAVAASEAESAGSQKESTLRESGPGAHSLVQVDKDVFEKQKADLSRLQDTVARLESELHSAKAANVAGDELAQKSKSELAETSKRLSSAQEELKAVQENHTKTVEDLKNRKAEAEKKLANAEREVARFKSDLGKSEEALQQERHNVLQVKQKASEVGSTVDDNKKILEAKVGELERIIASKQADIVRVRDKAKSYLRDINAEKRDMEERMRREAESLRSQLVEEQNKLKEEEQRAESLSTELDNCLALIREKQKSLQVLKMTITTEKRSAEEARREIESLRAEFGAYKGRARIALQEKETSADASEAAIDSATSTLRTEVELLRKDNVSLGKQIATLKQADSQMNALLDRAQKAEAAVDLLRKDATGVSTTTYRQIDALQEKIASLETELTAARASTEDAEARQETTMMRLEAAERALRGAELRAEEAGKLSVKSIKSMNKQIESLKSALSRAELSSAAAHRTAAVAAKALGPAPSQEDETVSSSGSRARNHMSPQQQDSIASDRSSYASLSPRTMHMGRSSLAVAMEKHTGLFGVDSNEIVDEASLEARDRQIAVLNSQLAELGALLDDAQQEGALKSEQTDVLKAEVKNLDARLAAAEKLQNGAPFSYLRTIVVRYLETDDPTLLPVVSNVLSFTKEEEARIKGRRGSAMPSSTLSANSQKSRYFSLPFFAPR
ncbi:unnamed protein product [Chondrus crispus]|uniref:GRIP domain-containing protein n=1 Tax=Chondrus crispus TaxID=2769 RepID=R7QIG5_CHOCR|nr:unnamed protein product [Chondrus crispus]CDF37210.1 unnamed protein product [Chondrus crispus]|eukprot:XP_005717029.1 unnamed protein product [Chondrus crispus]